MCRDAALSGCRRTKAAGAALVLLLLTACQIDVSVGVHADRHGAGEVRATVTMDREAATHVGDLSGQPRVEDLRAAGWRVAEPSETDDGGRRLRAVKSFASPEGAGRVVDELTGADGPLREFRLTQRRSFFKTRTALVGRVDLSTGVDGLADAGLRQQLAAAGVDAPTLERQLGVRLADVFGFEVEARLPGRSRTWTPRLGETVEVEASVDAWNTTRIAPGVVALASAVALVAVLVRRSRFVTWG